MNYLYQKPPSTAKSMIIQAKMATDYATEQERYKFHFTMISVFLWKKYLKTYFNNENPPHPIGVGTRRNGWMPFNWMIYLGHH